MSLKDWARAESTSGEITLEALKRFFEQVKNAPTDPCRLGKHVVSPRALTENWKYTRCANCYGIVQLR